MNDDHLEALYLDFFGAPRLDSALAGRCSAPLLLSVKTSWSRSAVRLLVVGQETMGWGFRQSPLYDWPYPPIFCYRDFFACDQGVEALMHGYREFNFAAKQPENYGSPFWRAFRKLGESYATEPLWSNLFRFSVDGGSVIRNCSDQELKIVLESQKGLLEKEIQVLEPSIVVFFTGPDYDFALRSEFDDVAFEPITADKAGQFDWVRSEGLTKKCIRTYHPGYLQRSGRWQWLDELTHMIGRV
jgi:hypothetical protein